MSENRDYRTDVAPAEHVYIYGDSNGGLALSTSGFTTAEDGHPITISAALLLLVAAKLVTMAKEIEAAKDA
jgi:hypothetical protein